MTRGTQGETALPAQKFSISGAQGKGQSRTGIGVRSGRNCPPDPRIDWYAIRPGNKRTTSDSLGPGIWLQFAKMSDQDY
jgi:hypothetical protein